MQRDYVKDLQERVLELVPKTHFPLEKREFEYDRRIQNILDQLTSEIVSNEGPIFAIEIARLFAQHLGYSEIFMTELSAKIVRIPKEYKIKVKKLKEVLTNLYGDFHRVSGTTHPRTNILYKEEKELYDFVREHTSSSIITTTVIDCRFEPLSD